MATLSHLPLTNPNLERFDFHAKLAEHGNAVLTRDRVTTLQINVGRKCNQACLHCHVEAGPRRTEMMSREVAEHLMLLLERSPSINTVDITGGAPEISEHFRYLVQTSKELGRHVIDRCNLTILFEEGHEDLAEFLAQHEVELIASLPCYSPKNVEQQRGKGVFDKSIRALRHFNELGYARPTSPLQLNLVYNPTSDFLPPAQAKLERDYKRELHEKFGIEFNNLYTITNLPIKRFAHHLMREGRLESYMQLLVENFNPQTLSGLMCRSLISVGYEGLLYDCDFNQMLDLEYAGNLRPGVEQGRSIFALESFEELASSSIVTRGHCFGCTAGAGSSCGGSIA